VTVTKPHADTAFRVAELIPVEGPWEVFAERSRRFEIHFTGRSVEMVRGPILLEGYGLRLFRFRDGATRIGFQASTDLSEGGIRQASEDAERLASWSVFPAKKIDLPGPVPRDLADVAVCDSRLWDQPLESIQAYVDALFGMFEGKEDVGPSFGSVRATLTETSITNSAGLRAAYPHTTIEFEMAVKAYGGPEGSPPGEYWVIESYRRLDPRALGPQVEAWCGYARDVRKGGRTPTGELPVLLPSSVLSGILPPVVGMRCTGASRLREMAPPAGSKWGSDEVNVSDDGRVPWALGSSPVDDEGTPQRRREVMIRGVISELLYDIKHAAAFDTRSSGNACRGVLPLFRDWRRFLGAPNGTSTTVVVAPGTGGSDSELIEGVEDGIWVQQLGWAVPDPLSGAFGGELRIGYRIRHGKLAEPIRGGTVGGVVMAPPGQPSLLANVAAVGSVPTLSEGVYSPTLAVKPLTVAGA
jgi:TldD protein